MKKYLIIKLSLLVALLFQAALANASLIVDTGPGVEGENGGLSLGGSTNQWLAAKFIINSRYAITSIEGWINPFGTGGEVTTAIYSDGGDVPGTQLMSSVFHIDGARIPGWYGVEGLSWLLQQGAYWVSFEVRNGSLVHAAMPTPVDPLLNYAGNNNGFGNIWEHISGEFGVMIHAVPEPFPLLFFLSGVVWFCYIRSPRRNS